MTAIWHKYPQELPPCKAEDYLVFDRFTLGYYRARWNVLGYNRWGFVYVKSGNDVQDCDIVAWTDLPRYEDEDFWRKVYLNESKF